MARKDLYDEDSSNEDDDEQAGAVSGPFGLCGRDPGRERRGQRERGRRPIRHGPREQVRILRQRQQCRTPSQREQFQHERPPFGLSPLGRVSG